MSIINDDIKKAMEAAEADDKREYRTTGEYVAEVTGVQIASKPKPWIDKGLVVDIKFPDEIGGDHKVIVELEPCTGKDGNINPGKIRFLRWQLGALGLDVDELAFQLYGIIGNQYKVEYKVDNGLDKDGNPRPDRKDRNPHTNLPYINKDCVFKEKIEKAVEPEELDLTAESEAE